MEHQRTRMCYEMCVIDLQLDWPGMLRLLLERWRHAKLVENSNTFLQNVL